MNVSVILCTYNRSASLVRALESIAACSLPEPLEWEVLVVDNNSTDTTREVIERFCDRYPAGRFRYIFEPEQGLSRARNAGIERSLGHILMFTDDDVFVDPNWLRNLSSCLTEAKWAGAAGRVLAANTFCCPRWLSLEKMGGMLSLFDRGDRARETSDVPFGANMAYRREIFEKYGVFRTDLGRCAGDMMSCEDTEFGRRVLSGGKHLWYEPSAIVYHPVPESRLKKAHFLSFWFNLGRASVREAGQRPNVWKIPRHYFKILKALAFTGPLRTIRWLATFEAKKRFFCKGTVWETAGEIAEVCRTWSFLKVSPLSFQSKKEIRSSTYRGE